MGVAALVAFLPASPAAAGRTREYFIVAEEVVWDFAPTGKSLLHGAGHSNGIPRPRAGNTRHKKARYTRMRRSRPGDRSRNGWACSAPSSAPRSATR